MNVHEALRKIRLLSRILPQNGAWGENRATLARALMDQFERQTRERLDACLAELNRIRPATLLREDILGRALDFRITGLPYFERTLELYHRLSHCDLDLVPLARLENITDDAESTVDQFRKILSFTGEDAKNPRDARDLLIKDVRDSFERISANLGIVLSPLLEQHQESALPTSSAFMVGLCILVLALAVLTYYSMHDGTVEKLLNAVHRVKFP
jgi:hypothetical protein